MKRDTEELLLALKFELEYIHANGYGMSTRSPWRDPSLFLDSPTCLNFTASSSVFPCEECDLHRFVPTEHFSKTIPCHHIPLNEAGQTVDSLEWETDEKGIEKAVEAWLRKTISKLEAELETNSRTNKALL